MSAFRRNPLAPAALAACVAVAASGCMRTPPPPAAAPPRPVRSLTVGAADTAVEATYAGQVRARYEARLGFQASGRVVERLVELGSRVRRGQVLLRLDPAQQTLQVAAASAEVDAARQRVAQNRVDVERTEQLLARQFASQAELDQQRLALAQSESQLRAALAQQQIRVNQRGHAELVADRDGVVSALDAEPGQVVAAGQPVLTLAGDGEREVVVSVPESRVDELRRAPTLTVTAWAMPGRQWRGRLRELAPDSDSLSRTYAARVAVEGADDTLRLGMTASVHVDDAEGRRAVRVPLAAVLYRDGEPRLWIVDTRQGKVASRAVRLGDAQGDAVTVTDGLRPGEVVVGAGVHLLHEGQAVRTGDAPSAPATGSAS